MKVFNCRLCNGSLSEPKLKFPPTPLANEFLKEKVEQDLFPLEVCACKSCGHYQLNEQVDPERMFRNYLFVAGTSPVNVAHFKKYAEDMVKKFNLKPGSRILDIASNDGTLLNEFQKLNMSVLGIDPARNLAKEATKNGIPTISEFFTEELADKLLKQHEQFDLITANNVFAHIPDMIGFAKGVKKLLKTNGVFSFEVSYFGDVCDKTLFDTIYHEHTSYHTVTPLSSFFDKLNLELFCVQRIGNHGGSLRLFVKNIFAGLKNIDCDVEKKATIYPICQEELNISARVRNLKTDIKILGLELREIIRDIKTVEQKSIAIYGTPAKATTLMYALGIKEEWIDFAVDDAPLKQETFTPGTQIPVLHPDTILEENPDYLLVLAWNFADSIIEKCKKAGYKGKFIIPLPELKVV
jgi:SAM-dependent methyltransferase